MQRGRGGRGDLFGFGDPFPAFRGFVPPGNLMSSFFRGSNPFDDPFFPNLSGSMIGPSLFEQSIFGSSMFGPHRALNGGGFQQQGPEPSRPKGPIIEELSSDDEDGADANEHDEKKKINSMKHPRISKEPYVEDPDEEVQDNKRPRHEKIGKEYVRAGTSYHQPQTYMFQSSTVTYGGSNGACYMSSTTRRSGGDGVTMEESKEADTTSGKATHRIARGIGNKVGPGGRDALHDQTVALVACGTQQRAVEQRAIAGVRYKRRRASPELAAVSNKSARLGGWVRATERAAVTIVGS